MWLGYQRLKMRATTVVVDHVRSFCDGCNVVFHTVTGPFRRIGSRIGSEAPWVIGIGACTFVTIIPLVCYPMIKKYVMTDPRAEAEAERVRLCLQKGMDPYPYMRHKDFVYGNNAPVMAFNGQMPDRVGWEYDALTEFHRRKEELRKEVGGSVDDTVQKLMKLREEQQEFYKSEHRKLGQEPKDLIFRGREDVNQLKS